jgi:diguanylate cyclase (GGDEF)-like protein/PAS domain S-box-containing protein
VVRSRLAGFVYLAGSALAAVSLAVPHGAGGGDLVLALLVVAAAVAGLLHLVLAARCPSRAIHVSGVAATALITTGLVYSGESWPAVSLLYAWVALYFAYLFPFREAAPQVGVAVAALVAVRVATDPSWRSVVHAVVASLLLASCAALVGMLSTALRRARDDERLRPASRTPGDDTALPAQQYRTLVEHIPLVTYVDALDDRASSLYMSPQIERMLGYSIAEWMDDPDLWTRILHPEDRDRALAANRRHIETFEPFREEYRLFTRDGRIVWFLDEAVVDFDGDGAPVCSRGYMLDITERKALEEQLAHEALHDPLTGLANRVLFKDRVQHAVARQRRGGRPIAVLFVDLDDFKTVNDSLGHGVGDVLLVEAGRRIQGCIRPGDTTARLGGDEFAVLLEDADAPAARAAAERIVHALDAPVHVAGREVFVTGSIGIAPGAPGDGVDDLLRNADMAMYRAKEVGKGRALVYDPAMSAAALERFELISDLQRALERGELSLRYQPILDLERSRIVGAEALVRWTHPRLGLLPPLEFVPLAEETGLVVPLGRWVRGEACRQLAAWRELAPAGAPLFVSVNLAPRELYEPDLVGEVASLLAQHGLAPSTLVFEVTEGAITASDRVVSDQLLALRELGVRIAIDDFGTGYSSLAHLKRLPVDIVKIAKPFVDGLGGGEREAQLARAVIRIGRALDIETVAEGIEHEVQHEHLRSLRCRLGQGFHFAEPMDAGTLTALIADSNRPAA